MDGHGARESGEGGFGGPPPPPGTHTSPSSTPEPHGIPAPISPRMYDCNPHISFQPGFPQVCALYEEVFNQHFVLDRHPLLYVTPAGALHISGFTYESPHPPPTTLAAPRGLPMMLLPAQSRPMTSLLRCVHMGMMAILVGPANSGKSRLVEAAAALTGNTLRKMPMTAGCDTVELLGGFEQVEGSRGSFGWRDSVLVQALEHGDWLVVENVNFCNPTVLDRLNPLLEPNGKLVFVVCLWV